MNMHEMEIGCCLTMQSLKTSVCAGFSFFKFFYCGFCFFFFFLSDTIFAFIKKKASRWEGKAGLLMAEGYEHQSSCAGGGKSIWRWHREPVPEPSLLPLPLQAVENVYL